MRIVLVTLAISLISLSMSATAVQINADQSRSSTEVNANAVEASQVHMYVMPNCGYCEKARQYFREQKISWRETDITANDTGLAEFKAKGGQGTPLIEVGTHKIVGFQADAIAAALKAGGS
jgi:glutaredoxin